MAVAFRNGTSTIDASTSATTVPFATPATPHAGDIWICSASFRSGGPTTISGVPAGFTLILSHLTSVSAASDVVSYWYQATGSESGTFATITLSTASKHVTATDAFSGVKTSAPIVVASITGGTNPASLGVMPTNSSGQADYFFGATQGSTTAPTVTLSSGSPSPTDSQSGATSGGSAATNVGAASAYTTTQVTASPTWQLSITPSTLSWAAFTIDAAPPVVNPPPHYSRGMTQAVHRAAHYFQGEKWNEWHRKRQSGLIIPDLVTV